MEDAIKVISTKFDLSAEVLNNFSNENDVIGSWMTILGAYILDNDKKQEEQKSNENLLRKQRLNAGKFLYIFHNLQVFPFFLQKASIHCIENLLYN